MYMYLHVYMGVYMYMYICIHAQDMTRNIFVRMRVTCRIRFNL